MKEKRDMDRPVRIFCTHCESTSVSSLFRFKTQETLRCDDCGGHFNIPSAEFEKAYDADYYKRNYLPREVAQLHKSRRYFATIRSFVPTGAVLDYGCGTGVFLQAACEAGYKNNVGTDVSSHALEIAAKMRPNKIEWVNLGTEKLPNLKFDIIALMDSISHIPDARATLEVLRDDYLAEGGVLVVRTPHIPPVYYSRVIALSFLMGTRNTSSLLFARSRHTLFDVASLQRFLESLGFKIAYEERSMDYRDSLPWSSGKQLIKEIVRRVVSMSIHSIFVIAERTTGNRS